MIDLNRKVAGSNPASSTKHRTGLEPPRPLHPLYNQDSELSTNSGPEVCVGAQGSPECRKSVYECRESVTYVERITQGIGTRDCHKFRSKIFDDIAPIAHEVAHHYLKISNRLNYIEANRFLGNIYSELKIHDLNLTFDLKQLRQFATQKSNDCLFQSQSLSLDFAKAFCLARFEKYKIELDSRLTAIEIIEYAKSEKFWFSRLKKKRAQAIEHVRRIVGLVHQAKAPYCSDERLRDFNWEQEQAKQQMANQYFKSCDGEYISMLDAHQANVSNPRIRRAELMVRIKGTEEYSVLHGHEAVFYTITTPSKYHSHFTDGRENRKYDYSTVTQANKYLNMQWQKARAKFKRENINVYGLRVVEPHHDATPHWHLILFMPPESKEMVTEILRHYSLEHDSNERGAKENRFKAEPIDPNKGDAQGYAAKYVSKNIDGEFLDNDEYGNDAKIAARRVLAWASLHNIRQFQFIGTPSVSLWRQLRRLTSHPMMGKAEKLINSADSSDWCTYMIMMGGANAKASEKPFKLEYEKQLKEHLKGFDQNQLSELAFNSKPTRISGLNLSIQLPNRGWTKTSAPTDQDALVTGPGDEVVIDSGGPPRERKGAPFQWG